MKRISQIALIAGFMLCGLLVSCTDELNGNGNLTVTVQHQGFAIARPVVYLNRDSTYHPDSLNDEYDRSQRADAAGVASFDNLPPGKYYVYARGLNTSNNRTVEGTDSVTVRRRYRQNDYEVVIKTIVKSL